MGHYSLGKCSIHWKSDLTADFYLKTFWAGNSIYVKATVSPRFQRNDLIIFFIAITLLLFASYYWGTRRILRKMKKRIIDPVGETWEGIKTGKSPKDLSLREIHDLWFSIEEYKVLARKKHRTEIARLFYHDLKMPVQFYSNRFLMLQKVKSYEELKEDIALTIEQGKLIESDMQRTMRKIAKDAEINRIKLEQKKLRAKSSPEQLAIKEFVTALKRDRKSVV